MVERLGDFVVPYQRALETGPANVLYLQGYCPLPRKNAEDIATFVDERQVLQDFSVPPLGSPPVQRS
jgi:hypothetical protein